jgi:hypothetical protein
MNIRPYKDIGFSLLLVIKVVIVRKTYVYTPIQRIGSQSLEYIRETDTHIINIISIPFLQTYCQFVYI